MSNVLNKITGVFIKSIHTPDYKDNQDWIINPTESDILQYKPSPAVITEIDIANNELATVLKWSDAEIDTFIGSIIEGKEIPQEYIDKYNQRKIRIEKTKE